MECAQGLRKQLLPWIGTFGMHHLIKLLLVFHKLQISIRFRCIFSSFSQVSFGFVAV